MYENSEVLGGKSACEAEMNNTQYCEGGVVLHPCCVGLLGECVVTTEDNCTFQKGHWHPDKVITIITGSVRYTHTHESMHISGHSLVTK